jgi:hypothetical protein
MSKELTYAADEKDDEECADHREERLDKDAQNISDCPKSSDRVSRAGFPKEQKPLLYPSVTVLFPFLYGYLSIKREIPLLSESKT